MLILFFVTMLIIFLVFGNSNTCIFHIDSWDMQYLRMYVCIKDSCVTCCIINFPMVAWAPTTVCTPGGLQYKNSSPPSDVHARAMFVTCTSYIRPCYSSLAGIVCRLQEGAKGSVEVNPMAVFQSAVLNAKPIIGTTRITRGGKHYHVRSTIALINIIVINFVHVAIPCQSKSSSASKHCHLTLCELSKYTQCTL